MRALLRLLAVISIAISPLSAQDTLAYTTASVRLREKPAATARSLALLRQGSPVRLYECAEGWCSVGVYNYGAYASRIPKRVSSD